MTVPNSPSHRGAAAQLELRQALLAGELELFYQPIIDLHSRAIRGVEALLRWRVRDTILMPCDFLPAVAQTGAMRELTRWVIGQACAQAAHWKQWSMSVNISAIDVVSTELVDNVVTALDRCDVAAGQLTLELTEDAAVQGLDAATAVLQRLRDVGVEVALDDFGTGYSSLLYLRDLPITQVKIDRTFVAGVDRRDDDAAIVDSIVRLGHSVGLHVIAEGVENPHQAAFLRQIRCDAAQGYLYAAPTAATAVPTHLPPLPVGEVAVAPLKPKRDKQAPSVPIDVRRRIAAMTGEGASLHTIAAALNRDGVRPFASSRWSATAVARVLRESAEVQPAAGCASGVVDQRRQTH